MDDGIESLEKETGEIRTSKIEVVDARGEKVDAVQEKDFIERLENDMVEEKLIQFETFLGKYTKQKVSEGLKVNLVNGPMGCGEVVNDILSVNLPNSSEILATSNDPKAEHFLKVLTDAGTTYKEIAFISASSTTLHEGEHLIIDSRPGSQLEKDLKDNSEIPNDEGGHTLSLLDEGITYAFQLEKDSGNELFQKLEKDKPQAEDSFTVATRKGLGEALRGKVREYVNNGKQIDGKFLSFAGEEMKKLGIEKYVEEAEKERIERDNKMNNEGHANVEDNQYKEGEAKYFSLIYHGKKMDVLELEHRSSTNTDKGESIERPAEWRNIIREKIKNTTGVISPEYCTPELAIDRAYGELVTGPMAENKQRINSMFDDSTINTFYDWVACCAGEGGKNLIAVDPADTSLYVAYELASSMKFSMLQKMGVVPKELNYTGEYGKIDPIEYKLKTSQDARHLLSARGVMEYSISSGNDVLHINSPVHAERVFDYIKRQKEYENNKDGLVNNPIDIVKNSPNEEKEKMLFYGKGGLERNIREYSPALPKEAYRLDMNVQELAGKIDFETNVPRKDDEEIVSLVNKIDEYIDLNSTSNNDYLKNYIKQLKLLKQTIGEYPDTGTANTYHWNDNELEQKNKIKLNQWINKIIEQSSTRKYWKLTGKKYIY